MVICLERGANLHMAQLMPLPLTVSLFSKIQICFTFLVPAYPGSPGKRAVKRGCVCVCAGISSYNYIYSSYLQCYYSDSFICMYFIVAIWCCSVMYYVLFIADVTLVLNWQLDVMCEWSREIAVCILCVVSVGYLLILPYPCVSRVIKSNVIVLFYYCCTILVVLLSWPKAQQLVYDSLCGLAAPVS